MDLGKFWKTLPIKASLAEHCRENSTTPSKIQTFTREHGADWNHLVKNSSSVQKTGRPALFPSRSWQCTSLFLIAAIACFLEPFNCQAQICRWAYGSLLAWLALLSDQNFTVRCSQRPELTLYVVDGRVDCRRALPIFNFFGLDRIWDSSRGDGMLPPFSFR